MSYLFEPREPRTSGQRLHQVASTVGFLALLALGPIVFATTSPARTRASVPAPDWSLPSFRAGTYTARLDVHVTEASQLTVQGRGVYNDALYRLGLLESRRVVFGQHGWLFLRESLRVHPNYERGRAARTAFLAQLRDRARRLGIEVLVVVVPSKARVYPEFLPPGHDLDAGRLGFYDRILQELEGASLPAVDVLRPMLASKAERPYELLYFRKDTHWAPSGSFIAARACRAALQRRGLMDRAGPVQEFLGMAKNTVSGETDLAGMLGLRPGGAAERTLFETHAFLGFQVASGEEYGDVQPAAAVALAGTSFSAGGLNRALPYELVRLVDCRGVKAGGGLVWGLTETLARLERGELPNCAILVWEVVEHVFAEQWEAPAR